MSSDKNQYMTGKDMLILPDGKTYHLGCAKGDIHPRILTVGSEGRAQAISELLDKDRPVVRTASSRLMFTFTGFYKGVGVTIIAIGMGAPMMDFMLREASYCVSGPMAVIRLGTCGSFSPKIDPGVVVVSKACSYCYVNYAHFTGSANAPELGGSKAPRYIITKPLEGSAALKSELTKALAQNNVKHVEAVTASGETFYCTQGRKSEEFEDFNETLVDEMISSGVEACEMESHQLFHLGSIRKIPCHVAAAQIPIVKRVEEGQVSPNISPEELHRVEREAGRACLEALVAMKL